MFLEVRVAGPIGAQVQAYIACTANCLAVTIDAPLANATINQPTMLVKGTVMSSGLSSRWGRRQSAGGESDWINLRG